MATFDATTGVATFKGRTSSQTWAHTVAANGNEVIFIGSCMEQIGADGDAATYNGTAMDYATNLGSGGVAKLWGGYLANPDTGSAYNCVMTFSASTCAASVAASYYGMNSTHNYVDTDAATPGTSVSAAGLTTGKELVGICGTETNAISANAGQTERIEKADTTGLWGGRCEISDELGGADTSFGNSFSSNDAALICFEFDNAAAAGGAKNNPCLQAA